jgi:two-component system cell cycle response regulator CtrA
MRVLLIEDEPTTAKAIELMLTTEGFNVYSTDLGEEGLDLGKLYDYDIILLDLNLPDMHGYDVLKKLRVAKVQTPVLILSGIAEMDSKIRSFGFGADDYVTKPFHRDELVAGSTPWCAARRGTRNRSSAPASWRSTSTPRRSKSTAPAST